MWVPCLSISYHTAVIHTPIRPSIHPLPHPSSLPQTGSRNRPLSGLGFFPFPTNTRWPLCCVCHPHTHTPTHTQELSTCHLHSIHPSVPFAFSGCLRCWQQQQQQQQQVAGRQQSLLRFKPLTPALLPVNDYHRQFFQVRVKEISGESSER